VFVVRQSVADEQYSHDDRYATRALPAFAARDLRIGGYSVTKAHESKQGATWAPPDVTIVIPTRDRPVLLGDAVGCALGQVDVDAEVVIVDDGSNPPVPPTIASPRSQRVRLLRHDAPHGDAAARNAGLRAARGRWVAFLDDDDLWAPLKLRKQLMAIDQAPGAVYAYCGALEVDAQLRVIRDLRPPEPSRLSALLVRRNVIPAGASNVIVRTSVLEHMGGFDENFRNLADWDLWLRLLQAGPAACCAERLVAYRRHSFSGRRGSTATLTPHSALADTDDLIRQLRALHRKHLSSPLPLKPDWVDYSRWLVAAGPRRAGHRMAAARLYLYFGLRHHSAGTVARGLAMPFGERVMQKLGERKGDGPAPDWLNAYR
jgi:hypothetical protein